MSYEKPELFTITLAAKVVHGSTNADEGSAKHSAVDETNSMHDGAPGDSASTTSTTSGAYEADE